MAGEKHILVYVARHGTTDLNTGGCFRGPINVPLDARGWHDAHQLGFFFEPIELGAIVHSDKQRTADTAKQISKHHKDVPVNVNENLNAFNVGDLGGQPKDKKNLATVAWHVEHPDVPLPGGESLNDFRRRVRPVLSAAVDEAVNTGLPVLLVTHSSIIHEVGKVTGGDHEYTLVEPGGVAAIFIQDGKLDAAPIFKPRPHSGASRPETIT